MTITIDLGNVIVAPQGETFETHCMDCGWHLSGAPTSKEASTVGLAHMSTLKFVVTTIIAWRTKRAAL